MYEGNRNDRRIELMKRELSISYLSNNREVNIIRKIDDDLLPVRIKVYQTGIDPWTGEPRIKYLGDLTKTQKNYYFQIDELEAPFLEFRPVNEDGREDGCYKVAFSDVTYGGDYHVRSLPETKCFLEKESVNGFSWTRLRVESNCPKRVSGHLWVKTLDSAGPCFQRLPQFPGEGEKTLTVYLRGEVADLLCDAENADAIKITRIYKKR